MGYHTEFTGELRFTSELVASQLAAVKSMCGEDCRKHPEWNVPELFYIDLELTDDFSGLRWDGSEKTYDLEKIVNVIINEMRKRWPKFGLTGTLNAIGENPRDRWQLTIGDDGMAHKFTMVITSKIIDCPHCGKGLLLEE